MVDRQEVEALLAAVDCDDPWWFTKTEMVVIAALCRAWLALDGAQEGVVEEWGRNKGEWYLDIRLTELSDGMHHERVRIVPVEGDQ